MKQKQQQLCILCILLKALHSIVEHRCMVTIKRSCRPATFFVFESWHKYKRCCKVFSYFCKL